MCGCHEAGYEIISTILKNGIAISWFVLITEKMAITNNVSGYVKFEKLAIKYGIDIYYAKRFDLKHDDDIYFFKTHKFDLLIQGGWQRLFPENILNTLKIGAIGGHGSANYLPKGRGRSPLNWSLIENQKRFIMHYFIIKPGIDDGDVFCVRQFDITVWDDIKTLYYKISVITSQMFLEWIPKLSKLDYSLDKQVGSATHYAKRGESDGEIDWNQSVDSIYNLVRAVTKPYPGAFSFLNNEEIKFWEVQPFDYIIDFKEMEFGTICFLFEDSSFVVKCNGGTLLVKNYEYNGEIVVGEMFRSKSN